MKQFLVLLVGLLPLYIVRFQLFHISTNAWEICVIGVVIYGLCFSEIRLSWLSAIKSIPKKIKFWCAVFLISGGISVYISNVPLVSLGILKGWIIIPMVVGCMVYVAIQKTPALGKRIISSLVCSGAIVALVGISQIGSVGRIYALYDVPNSLALFLVPLCIMAAWVGIREKKRLYQLLSICLLIAIVATQSVGALVALVGTALFVIPGLLHKLRAPFSLIREKGAVRYFIIAFILIISLFFLYAPRFTYLISPFLDPNTHSSLTVRFQLWDIGIRLIKQHPFLGIGLGQFEPAYQTELHRLIAIRQHGGPADKAGPLIREFVFRDPHNWIMSFWLNTGVLGLISFIGLNILACKKVFSSSHQDIYSQAAILALLSMLIFGLVDTIYWKNDLSALWWILLSMVLRVEQSQLD